MRNNRFSDSDLKGFKIEPKRKRTKPKRRKKDV